MRAALTGPWRTENSSWASPASWKKGFELNIRYWFKYRLPGIKHQLFGSVYKCLCYFKTGSYKKLPPYSSFTSFMTNTKQKKGDRKGRNPDLRCFKLKKRQRQQFLCAFLLSHGSKHAARASNTLILHMCVRLSQFGLHVFMWYQYIRPVASAHWHVVLSAQCPTFVLLYALNYSVTCIITLAVL